MSGVSEGTYWIPDVEPFFSLAFDKVATDVELGGAAASGCAFPGVDAGGGGRGESGQDRGSFGKSQRPQSQRSGVVLGSAGWSVELVVKVSLCGVWEYSWTGWCPFSAPRKSAI